MRVALPIADYFSAKKSQTSFRHRATTVVKPNGRSTDFIAPGLASGCSLACTYCYVARHRKFGNPVEIYTNREQIWYAVKRHHLRLGPKQPNQCDPKFWTYDIGESTDCLLPINIDNTSWYIQQFLTTNAKPSFATKIAGVRSLPAIPNRGMARVRVSLAPQRLVSVIEKGTSSIASRIDGIQQLYDRGYEVHVNFSPVVAYDGWTRDYTELMQQLDSKLSTAVKDQLKCEVIFLTHSQRLHESNLKWASDAEEYLWTPQWQETKTNERGDNNVVRYRALTTKRKLIDRFRSLHSSIIPYCTIRYIF